MMLHIEQLQFAYALYVNNFIELREKFFMQAAVSALEIKIDTWSIDTRE